MGRPPETEPEGSTVDEADDGDDEGDDDGDDDGDADADGEADIAGREDAGGRTDVVARAGVGFAVGVLGETSRPSIVPTQRTSTRRFTACVASPRRGRVAPSPTVSIRAGLTPSATRRAFTHSARARLISWL